MPKLNLAKTCLLCGGRTPCTCIDFKRQEDRELAEYIRIMDALDDSLAPYDPSDGYYVSIEVDEFGDDDEPIQDDRGMSLKELLALERYHYSA